MPLRTGGKNRNGQRREASESSREIAARLACSPATAEIQRDHWRATSAGAHNDFSCLHAHMSLSKSCRTHSRQQRSSRFSGRASCRTGADVAGRVEGPASVDDQEGAQAPRRDTVVIAVSDDHYPDSQRRAAQQRERLHVSACSRRGAA